MGNGYQDSVQGNMRVAHDSARQAGATSAGSDLSLPARSGFSQSALKGFLILGDFAVAALVVAAYPLLWSETFPEPVLLWGVLGLTLLLGLYLVEGYDVRAYREPNGLTTRLLIGVGISTVLLSVVALAALPALGLYRRPVVLLSLTLAPLLMVWRLGAAPVLRRRLQPRRVAVVGHGPALAEILDAFDRSDVYVVSLYVSTGEEGTVERSGVQSVRLEDTDLALCLPAEGIDLVAVVSPAHGDARLLQELVACRYREVEVQEVASCLELLRQRVPIRHLDHEWVAFSSRFMGWDRDFEEKLKRLIDVVVAGAGLILGLPVYAVVAVLVALTSGGPVFYRQERVGRGGSTFMLVKFRSMHVGAERAGAVWAERDDPRTTVVGRMLRKTHLDELPQLWNVLRGNMSLVGPRPERPEFVAELRDAIPYYDLRHVVKPGLTGWAQIRHPYGASVADAEIKLEFDLYYLRHKNLLWDLRILLRTLTVAVTGRGSR